jgi:RHS repeat-associated protein
LVCQKYTDTLGSENCNYTYDPLRQLLYENEHSYHFDSLYNRLQKDEESFTFNTLCQDCDCEYDENGNLLFDGINRYCYDSLDRLISITTPSKTSTFTYDYFNRRLSRNETLYIYDGENEIGSYRDGIQELRILGEGHGAEIGASLFLELDEKTYIPLHDQRGCVITLLDPTKAPCETYRYTAFGEELTGNTLSPWRFSSKRMEGDLVYFGRRYYAPSLGRWITQDPSGYEDGPNLYAYVHNSPLTSFDLYGLLAQNDRGYWAGVGYRAWDVCKDTFLGTANLMGRMGEWMYADFQYDYFNDRSLFQAKSQHAAEGWRAAGQFAKATYHNPMLLASVAGQAFIPGIMEVWDNPTSREAWGKATVDLPLISAVVGKIGSLGRSAAAARRISEYGGLGEIASAEKFLATTMAKESALKPKGIPQDWICKPSRKGGGVQYINPINPHDRIRVMPGNPHSPNLKQQNPYVKRQVNGQFFDKYGNIVQGDTPDAHISLDEFLFNCNKRK